MGGTVSADENIEMAKKAYAAFAAGDLEGAGSALDDQIEWIVAGNSAISGTYSGKDAVFGFWMRLAEKGFTTRPEHFLADEERVVVLTSITVGGETADQADVLTIRDGKVVKFQAAGDTGHAGACLGHHVAPTSARPGTPGQA